MAVGLDTTPLKFTRSPFKVNLTEDPGEVGWKGGVIGGQATIGGRTGTQMLFGWNKRNTEAIEAQRGLETAKQEFIDLDTSNIYADVENPYAGIKNPYADIQTEFENVYEDATVNQQQAKFEREQARQSQSNLLDQMRQAGGGAGMAQVIANQMTTAAAKTSASIGQQETAIQQQSMKGAADVQRMEQEAQRTKAKGAYDVDILGRQGAMEQQKMRLAGEEASRTLQYQKQQGLMSLYAGEKEAALAQAESEKGWMERTFGGSDIRLKHNIVFIKKSPSGLKIYNFEYKDSKFGEGVYQGVMSHEIPQDAVVKHPDGYDMVNYSKIDVDFVKIKD